MSDISIELQVELSERAKKHYSDSLPYHNWTHAHEMMTAIADLADRSIDLSLKSRRNLLIVAAAWHDADFHIADLGDFSSKEERSARLALNSLPELSPEQAELVFSGIVDTTVSKAQKSSLFGEVCHAADVAYFAAPPEDFMNRLELLRQEWDSPDWDKTLRRTLSFGQVVLAEAQDLMPKILTKSDSQVWLEQIQANLDSLQPRL